MSRNRVLVTGISGFIGRHVVAPLLQRGFEIHGLSSGPPAPATDDRIRMHQANLLQSGAPAAAISAIKPSHLLHLAWTQSTARMHLVLDNVAWARASLALFQAFAEQGGRRAVFAGSCAEYDWDYSLLIEDITPSRPRSIYGTCKNAVREIVQSASPSADVSAAWARIFYLYGPHEPPGRLVSDVAAAIATGRAVELTHGLQERDYLHVADAAEALAALLASDAAGTINVASGTAIPIRRIAEILALHANRADLLSFGRRPSPAGDPPRLVGDITRLRREIDFVPHHQLEDGLVATLKWWTHHLAPTEMPANTNR
jgi:nucleoside-diphosphate-sugar epimerase